MSTTAQGVGGVEKPMRSRTVPPFATRSTSIALGPKQLGEPLGQTEVILCAEQTHR